jgi:hypothetical protein
MKLVSLLLLVLSLIAVTSARVSVVNILADAVSETLAIAEYDNNVNEMSKLLITASTDNGKAPPGWRVVNTYKEDGHDKNKVFVNDKTKQVVIAYGGTQPNVPDWAKNFNVIKTPLKINGQDYGKVHSGFLHQFQKTEKQMFGSAMPYVKKGYNLEVTGHSQGGAASTIASAYAKDKYGVKDPKVVTFGSPAVGDSKFASRYNSRVKDTTRVVDTYTTMDGKKHTDVVPKVPLPIMGFKHVGKLKEVTTGRGDVSSSVLNHLMPNYERASRNKPVLDKHGPIVTVIGKGVSDVSKGIKGAADKTGKVVKDTIDSVFKPKPSKKSTRSPRASPKATNKAKSPSRSPSKAPKPSRKATPSKSPSKAPRASPRPRSPKSPSKASPKSPRTAPRSAPKAAPRSSPRAAPKVAPRSAPRTAPRAAPRVAPRAAPRSAPRTSSGGRA